MSTNSHWSQLRTKVQVMGVNAIVTIPLVFWIMRPTAIITFVFFILLLAFVLYVEKYLRLDMMYVPVATRYTVIGGRKVPRTSGFDI